MCMSNVLLGGAHRGALSIVNELQDKTVRQYDPNWTIADPKDNRAAQMAKCADKPLSDAPAPTATKCGCKTRWPYSRDDDYRGSCPGYPRRHPRNTGSPAVFTMRLVSVYRSRPRWECRHPSGHPGDDLPRRIMIPKAQRSFSSGRWTGCPRRQAA